MRSALTASSGCDHIRRASDEAHSVGVLGATGPGFAEHYGLDGSYADLWMGTLSKTLAGCGGYVAGRRELINYLRFATLGYVYLVGLPPPLTAIAIEALRIMRAEPERMAAPQCNRRVFLQATQAAGLDTGTSIGAAIMPVIVGSSIHAAQAAIFCSRRALTFTRSSTLPCPSTPSTVSMCWQPIWRLIIGPPRVGSKARNTVATRAVVAPRVG